MDGRKRTVQIKFRVTEAERDLILEKMKLVPTRNMAAYLRKIAIDGYIIQIDHADIKASPNLRGVTAFATTAPLPLGKAPCCVGGGCSLRCSPCSVPL